MSSTARESDAPTQRFASTQQPDALRSVAIQQCFRKKLMRRCSKATIGMRIRDLQPMTMFLAFAAPPDALTLSAGRRQNSAMRAT
ncbi:hypothetical protein AWV80_08065 [Cupriavidus sp. UYMU48A]|nr:hypothetical protein AWV80_08065 [Cupriavidus sp. UYMU48A]